MIVQFRNSSTSEYRTEEMGNMATPSTKIGLPTEQCRELFNLARRNAGKGKPLSASVFGYFEAFAAAAMQENATEAHLPIAIRCSPVTRRGFLKTIEQNLGRKPTVDEVLAPLLEGGNLNEATVTAIRLDIESLTLPSKRTPRKAQSV